MGDFEGWELNTEVDRREEEMTLYLKRSTKGFEGFEVLAEVRNVSRICRVPSIPSMREDGLYSNPPELWTYVEAHGDASWLPLHVGCFVFVGWFGKQVTVYINFLQEFLRCTRHELIDLACIYRHGNCRVKVEFGDLEQEVQSSGDGPRRYCSNGCSSKTGWAICPFNFRVLVSS